MNYKGRPDPSPPRRRKPYVKPVVESEQIFETLALACGKCQRGAYSQAQCRAYPKFS